MSASATFRYSMIRAPTAVLACSARWSSIRRPGLAVTSTSTHQIGHQWVDYWNWSAVSGDVERAGHQPEAHTPLLYPGEVYSGAVLRMTRRVAAVDDGAAYAIERTPSPVLLHPTTLYRMGLIGPEAVPDLLVFEQQGQFDEKNAVTPEVGTSIDGGVRAVHINDFMAEHGVRTGPVDQTWSRVTVVVSRDGLLSADEMSYWNLFAARHAATEGVTSWHGAPSFFEATGGRVPLRTDVTPVSHAKIAADFEVSHLSIDPREFWGVRLDEPVPAAIASGETVTIAGTVTATDRDFYLACVRWVRYRATADNQIFECGTISGDRFWVPYTFRDADAGNYALAVFLFFPDSGLQHARSSVSGIEVVGDPPGSPFQAGGGVRDRPPQAPRQPDADHRLLGRCEVATPEHLRTSGRRRACRARRHSLAHLDLPGVASRNPRPSLELRPRRTPASAGPAGGDAPPPPREPGPDAASVNRRSRDAGGRVLKPRMRRAATVNVTTRPRPIPAMAMPGRPSCEPQQSCGRPDDPESGYEASPFRYPRGAMHVAHIVPKSKGGGDERSNLQAAHARCNLAKGNRVASQHPVPSRAGAPGGCLRATIDGERFRAAARVARRLSAGARYRRTRMVGMVLVQSSRHRQGGDGEGLATDCLLEGLEILRVRLPRSYERFDFALVRGRERCSAAAFTTRAAVARA